MVYTLIYICTLHIPQHHQHPYKKAKLNSASPSAYLITSNEHMGDDEVKIPVPVNGMHTKESLSDFDAESAFLNICDTMFLIGLGSMCHAGLAA